MQPTLSKAFRFHGAELASKISHRIKNDIDQFAQSIKHHHQSQLLLPRPKVQVINIGNDPGSVSYICKKVELASQIGIDFHLNQFIVQEEHLSKSESEQNCQSVYQLFEKLDRIPSATYSKLFYQCTQKSPKGSKMQLRTLVEEMILKYNFFEDTSAILLQLPLHSCIESETEYLLSKIDPSKDPDCLTPENKLKFYLSPLSSENVIPCTPKGIMAIFEANNIPLKGENVVLVGKGQLVGKPLIQLLLAKGATTTVCHKHTKNLSSFTKNADIVIAAAGVPELVQQVKEGSVLIDVGINRNPNTGKLCGDISKEAKESSSFYTPVPGGVGPLTVVMLMENIYQLWRRRCEKKSSFKINQ